MTYSTNSTSNRSTNTRTKIMFIYLLSIRTTSKNLFTIFTRYIQMIKSFFSMHRSVFILSHYFKIFNSIIKSIFIYMMNYFFKFKFSAKILLHYISMFKNLFSINCENFITSKNTSRTIGGIFTNRRITVSLPSSVMNTTPSSFSLIFPIRGFVASLKFTSFFHNNSIAGTKINTI